MDVLKKYIIIKARIKENRHNDDQTMYEITNKIDTFESLLTVCHQIYARKQESHTPFYWLFHIFLGVRSVSKYSCIFSHCIYEKRKESSIIASFPKNMKKKIFYRILHNML